MGKNLLLQKRQNVDELKRLKSQVAAKSSEASAIGFYEFLRWDDLTVASPLTI